MRSGTRAEFSPSGGQDLPICELLLLPASHPHVNEPCARSPVRHRVAGENERKEENDQDEDDDDEEDETRDLENRDFNYLMNRLFNSSKIE